MRITTIAAVSLSMCFVVACTNTKENRSDSGPESTKSAVASTQTTGRPKPPKNLILERDLIKYATDADGPSAFRKFANKLSWKPNERDRKCRDDTKCHGQPLARMQIDVPEGSHYASFITIDPNTSVLVGRLESTGDEEDILFHDDLLPHNQHASGYVVLVGDASGTVSPFLAVYTKKAGKEKLVLHGPLNAFKPHCDDVSDDLDEGDFKTCNKKNAGLKWDDPIRVQDAADASAWFSCAEGCCGASFPPFVVKGDKTATSKPRS